MKKILSVLVLIGFLAVMVIPMVASAQQTSPECCKLNTEIKFTSGKVNDVECTPASPCTLAKNSTVGDPTATKCPGTDAAPTNKTDAWGMACLLNTLSSIVNWIFVILTALAAIFVIMGAFQILTAAGAPEKITSGRNYILYAAIGLLVAFLAKAVPGVVRMVSGF